MLFALKYLPLPLSVVKVQAFMAYSTSHRSSNYLTSSVLLRFRPLDPSHISHLDQIHHLLRPVPHCFLGHPAKLHPFHVGSPLPLVFLSVLFKF